MQTKNSEFAVIAIIPVGPFTAIEALRDTLTSIKFYAALPTKIVLLDNSGSKVCAALQDDYPEISVLQSSTHQGKGGKLYYNLALAFETLLSQYDFKALLRIDDDGLVIGKGGDIKAIAFFEKHPEFTIIGSHRTTCTGGIRDFTWADRELRKLAGPRGVIKQPRLFWAVRSLLKAAYGHGYQRGEHCMGGVCYLNPSALATMAAQRNLVRPEFINSILEEDQIFSLLAFASGLKIGDFATGDLPIGAAWRGLPCSPQALERAGKKLTHSVRFYLDMGESEIRAYFRARRQETHSL